VFGSEAAGKTPAMRRVAAWLSWFAGLLVLWFVLVGTVQDVERIAGLAAAAIGATAAEVIRASGLLRYRVEARWVRRGLLQLLRVVPDFFRVIAALGSKPRGAFRTVPFPAGGERDVDRGRRAWVTLTASLAPNRLVVDLDADTGEALVHDLRPGAASREQLV
jgi:hypothetical protein